MKRETALRTLNRLSTGGVVPKVCRGVWWNPFYPPPNPFCLHKTIAPDSYVSSLTALWWHGIMAQRPGVVTCVRWAGRSFTCSNEYGRYQFVQVPREVAFGFREVENQGFALAEPEKALLDHIYIAKFVLKQEPRLVELDLEGLDPERLKHLAERMGPETARYLRETRLADPARWAELAPRVR